MAESAAASRQRIDKWLFFTRLAKSRTLAQDWVEAGHVTVNGQKIKRSSADVKIGDRLIIQVVDRETVVIVRAPGSRRGPFEEARLLYEDISPPSQKLTPYERIVREQGSGRPEKKERRQLDRLKNRFDFKDDN
jgi:ribosome-associated heat shock protein Hsp15